MGIDTFTHPAGQFPSGTIIPWSDDLSEIPQGWALCDGNNGTPNLLDKFVMSVPDGATDPGNIVGQDSYTLSTSQVPSHSHDTSTDTVGDHYHGWSDADKSYDSDGGNNNFTWGRHDENDYDGVDTSTDGSHTHSMSVGNTGSGNSIDNKPNYFETAFIKKL